MRVSVEIPAGAPRELVSAAEAFVERMTGRPAEIAPVEADGSARRDLHTALAAAWVLAPLVVAGLVLEAQLAEMVRRKAAREVAALKAAAEAGAPEKAGGAPVVLSVEGCGSVDLSRCSVDDAVDLLRGPAE